MILTFLSFAVLGVALLWALRLIYSSQEVSADDTLILTTTIAAWVLIFLALSALFSPLGGLVALIIGGMVVAKYRDSERRALLWTLAVSAERGLPLAPAARSFAVRRSDEIGRRAALLADLLEAGVSLPEAFRRSANPLPTDAWLAARLGTDTNSLATSLQEAAREGGRFAEVWRPVFERTLYFLVLTLVGIVLLSFMFLKIIPTFEQIFADFDLELPGITRIVITGVHAVAGYWFVIVPVLAYLVAVFLIGVVHYVRGRSWESPVLGWFLGSMDTPYVLRALAQCAAQMQPFDQALERLAKFYPRAAVRRRLLRATEHVRNGCDWIESLRGERLIRDADSAVLQSARRAGNLDWALREIADSSARRIAYRGKALLSVALPALLICFAAPVALVSVAFIYPLAGLILHMSSQGL